MNNKKIKKLKIKVWIISTIILITYIIALVLKPTIITALLPIIIPTALLTIGIPTYAIIKNSKDTLKYLAEDKPQKIIKQNTKTNTKTKQNTDLIDDIVNDKNLTSETKKQMLETLKAEYEQDNKEKINYQKTKGTIN